MTSGQALIQLIDTCDIYFEDSLISKERIIKSYAKFFADSVFAEGHSVSVALHTGSVCFELISLIIAALACVSLDKTDSESILDALAIGKKVLYKNERHRWLGKELYEGITYMVLEQDGRGKHGRSQTKLPFDRNKNYVKPYHGDSELTDGRGIRQKSDNRADFISHVLGTPLSDIPSVTQVATVIVVEREVFEYLSKGIRIDYGEGKSIGLLDIVTAAYYTDGGNEYQYGNNPAKAEPVLKVTGKVSTARDLVLSKHGNKAVGFMIISSQAATKGGSELADLFARKSLSFSHVAVGMDSDCTEDILEAQEDAAVFACTKEFLLQNSLPPQEKNSLTAELDRQIENILNNEVTPVPVAGGCAWEDFRRIRETLSFIKKSDWADEAKNRFVIAAYSLLNLLVTAVFPMNWLESLVQNGHTRTASPMLRIRELREMAYAAGMFEQQCTDIVELIEYLYLLLSEECPKYTMLKRYLASSPNRSLDECSKKNTLNRCFTPSSKRKIAVIVPKSYYVDVLNADATLRGKGITIITANRFDDSKTYDEIIVVGNFREKRFNPFKCKAAADISVLLYDCEMQLFDYKRWEAESFEKKLNTRLGVLDKRDESSKDEDLDAFVRETNDLEQFIEKNNVFDIGKYAIGTSGSSGSTSASEVYAIGRFISGEQVLFSKYYTAVVFDSIKKTVSETEVENLSAGDTIVFAKRNDYTRNVVDDIWESLQSAKLLSSEIIEAKIKSHYWKEALRKYKDAHALSYRGIAKELSTYGSTLQEVTVRQWLMEESHIVGPRDIGTLEQIAVIVNDDYLYDNMNSIFESFRLVRRQRKIILVLISTAIADKLSGRIPSKGSPLAVAYDNIDKLSELLELEDIITPNEPISVPTNLINRPLTE